MDSVYNASSIKIYEGLEGIRNRPDMYITNTSSEGLHQCFTEGFVNAVDEAQVGFGKVINVQLLEPTGFTIEDFGRGIPVENYEDTGMPTAEILYTTMHSGGKMNESNAYKTAVGQMGLGCKILNTLGEYTQVVINRDGYSWDMEFSKMKTIKHLTRGSKVSKTGTFVKWIPDATIFDTTRFSYQKIKSIVKEMSYLTPGVKYNLKDDATLKEETFMSKKGLYDLYDETIGDEPLLRKPIVIEGSEPNLNVEILFNYTSGPEFIRNYVNCLKMTEDSGTHMAGFKSGLTKAINQFAKDNNILKDKDKAIEGSELKDGMYMIMKFSAQKVKFANQTKTKVNNPEFQHQVASITYNKLMEFFRTYPNTAQDIIKKALTNRRIKQAIQKAKELALGTKENKRMAAINSNLKACSSKKPEECSLFIIEGESAGGTVVGARNPMYHAVLPLRGKIANTADMSLADALKNKVLSDIIITLGTGIGDDFDISNLRYDKIVITTDADVNL